MATKGNLITAINTQLTAIITQAKVRTASALIVAELYPAQYKETYESSTTELEITEQLEVGFYYVIKFKKVGNTVFVDGNTNNKTLAIFNGNFLQIVNSEFLPKTGDTFTAVTDLQGRITLTDDGIMSITSTGEDAKEYFNFTYTTND